MLLPTFRFVYYILYLIRKNLNIFNLFTKRLLFRKQSK